MSRGVSEIYKLYQLRSNALPPNPSQPDHDSCIKILKKCILQSIRVCMYVSLTINSDSMEINKNFHPENSQIVVHKIWNSRQYITTAFLCFFHFIHMCYFKSLRRWNLHTFSKLHPPSFSFRVSSDIFRCWPDKKWPCFARNRPQIRQ